MDHKIIWLLFLPMTYKGGSIIRGSKVDQVLHMQVTFGVGKLEAWFYASCSSQKIMQAGLQECRQVHLTYKSDFILKKQ